jgi:hypothetical protein
VGDVDGDALLALGPQAVGEEGQVDVVVAPPAGVGLDRGELVLENRLGVVEQPSDQGALPVVDRARGGDPQQVDLGARLRRRGQK